MKRHTTRIPFRTVLFALTLIHGARAQDRSHPITLDVDATETPRKIIHARMVFPAKPGPLTLLYPKWIPGEHAPTGPITDLAGLRFEAAGKVIPWRRDPLDMCAFHCDIPKGADAVSVSLDFLISSRTEGFSNGASATDRLCVLSWNQILLYPKGFKSDALFYTASARWPTGWHFGTALPVARSTPERVEFKPVSLTTLVDSPIAAGLHYRRIELTKRAPAAHYLHVVADSDAALAFPTNTVGLYSQLVAEAGALFKARHYHDYHFLLTLSDQVPSFGLEHHESSDNRVGERTFIDEDQHKLNASLLPHEMVHSWNGKFRRPAGLATADFHQPMQTDMLWVYEGLTQYLGSLLAARSGLWTPETYRDALALAAARLDRQTGRRWRPLSDTATAAQLLYEASSEWNSWRRGVDFYDEGWLLWLEADAVIRQKSGGRKSLDDFCRSFLGGSNSGPEVRTYTFDDIVQAMDRTAGHDWRTFFEERVHGTATNAPLGGIAASGWKLAFDETASVMLRVEEASLRFTDLRFSIGITLKDEGVIGDVVHGSAAEKAGVAPGMKLVAVNGRRYASEVLRDAIHGTKGGGPLEFLVESHQYFKTLPLNYHEGERYPHLERDNSRTDLLERMLAPLAPRPAPTPDKKP